MSFCQLPPDGEALSTFQKNALREISTGSDPAAVPDDIVSKTALMQRFGRGMPGIASSDEIWNTRLKGNTPWGPISHGELLEKIINVQRKAANTSNLPLTEITKSDVEKAAPVMREIVKADAALADPSVALQYVDKLARLGSETALLGSLQLGRQYVSNVMWGNVSQQLVGGQFYQVIMQAIWGADSIQTKSWQRLKNSWQVRVQGKEGLSYVGTNYGGAKWGAGVGLIDEEALRKQGMAATLVPADEVSKKRGLNTQWGRLLATPFAWMRRGTDALVDDPANERLWSKLIGKAETATLYTGPAEAEFIRDGVQGMEHSMHSAAFFAHAKVLWKQRFARHEVDTKIKFMVGIMDEFPDDAAFHQWAENLYDEATNWLKYSSGRKGEYTPTELYIAMEGVVIRDGFQKVITPAQHQAALAGVREVIADNKQFLDTLSKDAKTMKDKTLFNYEERVIDVWGSRIFPFFRFYSRYLPFMFQTATKHPILTMHYFKVNQHLQEEAKSKGWPTFMSTFLELTSGPTGLQIALNPFHAAGLMDFAWVFNMGDRNDPDKTGLQNFIDSAILRNDLSPAPYWYLILPLQYAGLLGPQNRAINPLDYTLALKQVNLLTNLAIAKGVIPHDGPVAPFGQGIANWMAEYISKKSPVGTDLQLNNPDQDIQGKIQQTMVQIYLKENGIPYNQWLYAEGEHQKSLDPSFKGQVNQDMVDMYDAATDQLIEEYTNEDGHYYDAAFDSVITTMAATKGSELISIPVLAGNLAGLGPDIPELSTAFLAGETMGSPMVGPGWRPQLAQDKESLPGPWLALEDQDSEFNQQLIETGVDPDAFWDDVYYYQVAINQEWDTPNLSSEARTLTQYDNAFKSAGGKKRQDIYDTYYQIIFGNLEEPITINGQSITPEVVAAMGDDYRTAAAKIWLAEQPNGQEALDTVSGAKEEILKVSPEYKHYQAWVDDGHLWEENGGLALYRKLVCEENQGQCQYYEDLNQFITRQVGKDVAAGKIKPDEEAAEIARRMDAGTLSLKAYMAAFGIKFDNSKYNEDDIGKQPKLPESVIIDSIDTAGNTVIPGKITEDRLAAAQMEYDVYAQKANAWLQENFGATLDTIAPIAAPVAMKGLAEAGIVPPADGYMIEDFKLYQEYATANNLDPSPKAYIEFLDLTSSKPGTWANQREFHPMPGGWGFNTGINYGEIQYVQPHQRYGISGPASMGQNFGGAGYISGGGIGGMGQKVAQGPAASPFGLGLTGGSRVGTPDPITMGQRIGGLAARMSSR